MTPKRNLTAGVGTLGSGTPREELPSRSIASIHESALDDADIQEFATLWQEEFDEKLTPDQARYQASLLLELYLTLYQARPDRNGSSEGPQ